MDKDSQRPVRWVGSSYDDGKGFPGEVQDVMGYALHQAQRGRKAGNSKPLKGFKGASVLEIVDDYDSNTYRAIYTVQYKKTIYVLHAFQKKSKKGIATPKSEIKLIGKRLQAAREHYETNKT